MHNIYVNQSKVLSVYFFCYHRFSNTGVYTQDRLRHLLSIMK